MREPEPYDHGRNGRKRKRRRHVPLYRHRPLYRGQLGPLVGHKLRRQRLKGAAVIGTLDKPVHAMNLELYIRYIQAHYSRYVVVAIDASVAAGSCGYATLGRGSAAAGAWGIKGVRGSRRYLDHRDRRGRRQP